MTHHNQAQLPAAQTDGTMTDGGGNIPTHPVHLRVQGRNVMTMDGVLIAEPAKGFRFYWHHNHLHVCREQE